MFHLNPPARVLAESNGMAGLESFAGQILSTCVVLTVVAAVVSAVSFLVARLSQNPEVRSRSIAWAVRVLAGAVVLGSLSGAIFFGSGMGTTSFMPAAAQPVDVTIKVNDRPVGTPVNPPWTPGPAGPDHNFGSYACGTRISTDFGPKAVDVGKAVLGSADFATLSASMAVPPVFGDKVPARIQFTQSGEGCDTSKPVPDPCLKVEVFTQGWGGIAKPDLYAPINAKQCKS